MLKSLTYQCPECSGSFRQLVEVGVDGPPRYCPKCGFDSEGGEQMEEGLAMPHIGKSIKGVVDNMHREMEAGADFRAAMAQDQFGLDSSEASMMKLGDMKDGLRAGDTSNIEVINPVTQTMDAAPKGTFGFQGDAGLGYSGTVASGPFPNAGARAQNALRQAHVANTAGAGQVGATTSSLPALETMAPNYRRRL